MNYHELVPIPAIGNINTGLSACTNHTMMRLFGNPGRLTQDCSDVTSPELRAHIKTHAFNNFTVEGWGPAVDSLVRVLTAVYATNPTLHSLVRSSGMLCCRAVRGSSSSYSNHSWGTAIDLRIESQLDELGSHKVQKGILALYPYFHKEGWFWAAGYRSRPDPMHFELADETVRKMFQQSHEGA